jgi:hypothetical protein
MAAVCLFRTKPLALLTKPLPLLRSEMAAVCLFLLGTDPKKQDEYLDAAYR